MEDQILTMLDEGFSSTQIVNELCAQGYDLDDVIETLDEIRASR